MSLLKVLPKFQVISANFILLCKYYNEVADAQKKNIYSLNFWSGATDLI